MLSWFRDKGWKASTQSVASANTVCVSGWTTGILIVTCHLYMINQLIWPFLEEPNFIVGNTKSI